MAAAARPPDVAHAHAHGRPGRVDVHLRAHAVSAAGPTLKVAAAGAVTSTANVCTLALCSVDG
jgi:hypothetical protein